MNVFDLAAKISLDTSEYEGQLSDASGKTHNFGEKLKNGLATAAKVGAAAIGTATAAVGAFAKASIDTGMQFDSSMSQVAATMGTTVDAIGELRDFAMDMGAKTAFSATEAADALNYMALAGYDADEAMSALPNVLNLAAAGGIDLAYASDMVTDAQSALGLSMEESAQLVDKMAMASSKSNTSVSQLGEAILTIGGTAKNLAGGTTELSTALGILADNGVKGAEGGTALRNIILSLSAPTDKAAASLAAMGVEVYDAAGNMRPLNETFGDLEKALSSMTQGEQTEVLNTIFNKVDLKSVNALLANTGERFDELSGYIDNASGAAENMANTQLDNLAGDITLFKSALEGAQIVLSDQLTPGLREFVQFGSEGISKIASAFQEGGLSGAMDAFGEVLSDGLNMIIEHLPAMVDAGMQLLGSLAQGLLDNLPTITSAALEIVMTLINGAIEALPEIVSAAVEIVTTLASGISESLPELIPAAIEAILQIVETLIDNVDQLVDAAIEIILALADGLIEALPKLIEKAPVIIEKLVTAIANNLPKIIQAGMELIVKLNAGIIKNIPALVKAVPEVIGSFISGIAQYYANIINAGKEIVGKVGDGIKSIASGAAQWGKDLIDNFVSGIKNAIGKVKDAVSNVASTVKSFIGFSEPEEGPLSNFHTYAPDMMQLFAQGITENAGLLKNAFDKSLDFGIPAMDFSEIYSEGSYSGKISIPHAQRNLQNYTAVNQLPPISLTIPLYLDGNKIGEAAYTYIQNRERAYGGAY